MLHFYNTTTLAWIWLPLHLNFYPLESKHASKIMLLKWNFIEPCFYVYLVKITRFISCKWLPNVPLDWAQFNLKGAIQITLLLAHIHRFECNPTPSIKSCHKSTHWFWQGKKTYTSVATHISIGDMLVDPPWFFFCLWSKVDLLYEGLTFFSLPIENYSFALFYIFIFICIAISNSSTACFFFLNGNIESMTFVKRKKKQFRKLPC